MPIGEIKRNISSVLFRYLPGCYVSFDNLITTVEEIDSVDINVNKQRIFSRILNLRDNFDLGFELPELTDDLVFRKPRSVRLRLHPLTMYCSECYRGYEFDEAEDIARRTRDTFRCPACKKGYLKQLPFVYVNEYGFVGQIELKNCKSHKEHWNKFMRLDKGKGSSDIGKWRWVCNCGDQRDLNGYDPASASKPMWPIPATASTVFYPHHTSFVNLPDEEMLHQYPNYKELILGYYLGLLSRYNITLKQTLETRGGSEEAAAMIEKLKGMGVKITDDIKKRALTDLDKAKSEIIKHIKDLLREDNYEKKLDQVSYSILEFLSCKEDLGLSGIGRGQKFRSMSNLIEEESDIQLKEKYKTFRNKLIEFGIKEAWIIEDLSIITAVFGYSRKEFDPKKCKLKKFPEVQDDMGNFKTPVYGSRDITEGILFELDRKMILDWLKDRGLVKQKDMPKTDREMKEWFIQKLDTEQTQSLNELDPSNQIQKEVYNLIHSMSHALLITGSDLCGIDKESMSEIIFSNVPAIILYSGNPSEMGAMTALFEGAIIPWLDKAAEHVSRCIYDPICINDEKGACLHCAYISEISCCRLNKDLDRKTLVGNYKAGREVYKGFWHDQLRKV